MSSEAIVNVSDWLHHFADKPRDVSLLYASDRKLFDVTSQPGRYSLAVLADYPAPRLPVVFLLCINVNSHHHDVISTSSYHRSVNIRVSEDVPVGTTVGSVVGIQGGRHYDIISGNDATLFEIDHVTGNISTQAELDYEQHPLHRLVVRITAAETETDVTAVFVVVTVSVDDVNEHRPVFPVAVYRRTVFGSQKAGLFVASVKAIDRDSGRFGRVIYRPHVPTTSFIVDRTSGHVWLRLTSRYDVTTRLGVTVAGEDVGGRSDRVRVELIVRPGVVTATETFKFKFHLDGSVTVGYVVGILSVGGRSKYSVSRGSEYFDVERHTGRLLVVRDLRSLASQSQVIDLQTHWVTLTIDLAFHTAVR